EHGRRRVERLHVAAALAVGLVADLTVGGVDLLAAGDQRRQLPDLARIVGLRRRLLGLLARPRGVVLLRDHLDVDRHVGVLLAAELVALAVVVAGLGGAKPRVADEPRDRVLLDAERGYAPGVDDVGGGRDDADLLVDRDDEGVVDAQQVVVALRRAAVRRLALGDVERRQEADAGALAVQIVVAPLPLQAR